MATEHLYTKEEYWKKGKTKFTACGIEVDNMTAKDEHGNTHWGTNFYDDVNCPECLKKYPPYIMIDGKRFEHEEEVMVDFTSYAKGKAKIVFKANCPYVGQGTGWYIRDYYREYRSINQMESIKKILTPEQQEREDRLAQLLDKENKKKNKWWKFW